MVHEVTAIELSQATPASAPSLRASRMVGFFIVAVMPAAFWTVILWLAGLSFGWQLSGWSVAIVAAALLGFLACIWASFAMADRSDEDQARGIE